MSHHHLWMAGGQMPFGTALFLLQLVDALLFLYAEGEIKQRKRVRHKIRECPRRRFA